MKDNALKLNSPAKINLFLRIIKKRPDGYHELASLFQTIDLCDTLHLSLSDTDSLTCDEPNLPVDQNNLVVKAVNLYKTKTNLKINVSIHLEKIIPQQAGLGGGSSNAATTLWGINRLCGSPVSEADLIAWGAEIRSDVSFFLSQGTAYCTGRGEMIRAIEPLANNKIQIVKPEQGLSTPLVYKTLNASLLPQRDPDMVLDQFLKGKPVYFNDLETPAFNLMPELANIKEQLLHSGYSDVLMCGSGSSFFCVGHGRIPKIHGLKNFQANFINRATNQWYGW